MGLRPILQLGSGSDARTSGQPALLAGSIPDCAPELPVLLKTYCSSCLDPCRSKRQTGLHL